MATIDDINSTLQNIARQLGMQAQSEVNAFPVAIATSSPITYAINNLGTSAITTVLGSSTVRHGLIFHNPGTANIYIFPTNVFTIALASTTPTTALLGGTLLIAGGSTLSLPSTIFPNVNTGWRAFSGTGSGQSLTIVEFF